MYEMNNIVLIGMPGCGKTTLGKILSEELGYKYIDIDEYIEENTGKSITEIFNLGEEYFRKLERQAVYKLSREKASIICTGGGVIKDYLNIQELKKNGVLVFIDRPIDNIAEDVKITNRPVLKEGTDRLHQLYYERYELYKKYCDIHVINDKGIKEAVERIKEILV